MIEKKTLKTLYLKTKPVKFLWRKIYYLHKLYLLKINPKIIANSAYKSAFGKNINWKNPKDLIEKIYYLQLYTDTRLWTYCADKYLVREYLKEKGCETYLETPIYGVWSDPTQIKWSSLPDRFVLKSNHACGQVIMIEDKNSIDFKKTQKKISGWLTTKYGVLNAQLHYTKIKPLILAEKNLKSKDKAEEFLIDYKICVLGESLR